MRRLLGRPQAIVVGLWCLKVVCNHKTLEGPSRPWPCAMRRKTLGSSAPPCMCAVWLEGSNGGSARPSSRRNAVVVSQRIHLTSGNDAARSRRSPIVLFLPAMHLERLAATGRHPLQTKMRRLTPVIFLLEDVVEQDGPTHSKTCANT